MTRDIPINAACPWSGRPVSEDARMVYRGHLVGFCNPACRDRFAGAVDMFDQLIAGRHSPALAPVSDEGQLPQYRSRFFRSAEPLETAGMRLKRIEISLDDRSGPVEGVEAACAQYLAVELSRARRIEGADHGVGYLIHHHGETAEWLLTRWWARGDIAMGLVAYRAPGGEFVSLADRHFASCVWEDIAISHERKAWVEEVMTGRGSVEAYLDRRMPTGWH